MMCEDIPKVRYDLVELYWKKTYTAKEKKSKASETQAATEQKQTTAQSMISQTSRQLKRKPNRNELLYNDYINSTDHLEDDLGPQSQIKNFVQKQQRLTHRSSTNIIHDFEPQSHQKPESDFWHRQSQSTRNIPS